MLEEMGKRIWMKNGRRCLLLNLVMCLLLGRVSTESSQQLDARGTKVGRVSRRPSQEQLKTFQKLLGYQFQDEQLLLLALTHPSYSEYNHLRLHFLGSHVLNLAAATDVYNAEPEISYSDMDHELKLRLNESACYKAAQEVKLDDVIILGKSASRITVKMLIATFKALLGAVHLDSTFETAMKVCENIGIGTASPLGIK